MEVNYKQILSVVININYHINDKNMKKLQKNEKNQQKTYFSPNFTP